LVQVNISARHGNLSPATQEKISEKVERLKRFFDRLTSIQVTVDLKHRESVEVELKVSAEHTRDFVATEAATELFAALDRVVRKIEQQLRKHKEKIQAGHRQPGRKQLEVPLDSEAESELE
jgi:putative sigma-54 modulation protein